MALLIVVVLILVVGGWFLLSGDSPKPVEGPPATEADTERLREAVLAKLRDAAPGWSFEPVADKPLEIVGTDSATERTQRLELSALAPDWLRFDAAGAKDDAADAIDAFIAGAMGSGTGEEGHDDGSWASSALAVKLVEPGTAPKAGLTKPAGPLLALLVVRSPQGAEPATKEDLEAWGIDETEGFRLALENLTADVDEGLRVERDDEDEPKEVLVAAGDPLAASYVLVPGLAAKLKKIFGDRDAQVSLLASSMLVAQAKGAEAPAMPPGKTALIAGPIDPSTMCWKS